MMRHTFTALAAALLACGASPVAAQNGEDLPPMPPLPAPQAAQPAYPAAPAGMPAHALPAYPGGPYPGEAVHPGDVAEYPPPLPPVPSVGYTAADREAWLGDCRAEYYGEDERKGGFLGGLLGAVTGGLIGHEVTGGSDTRRIGGTLIGAGVGGLAGLAIGSVIGAASDHERIDECEAYLRRYEAGYGHDRPGYRYHQAYGHAAYGYPMTMMMVPVQIQTHYSYSEPIRRHKEIEVEEWVEEKVVETTAARRPGKYVKAAPATKLVKTVRSTK